MTRNESPALIRILFGGIFNIIVLLGVIFLLNYLKPSMNSDVYGKIVDFFDKNLAFLIVMTIVFWIAELFLHLSFPVNLLFPWVNAIGSILVVTFIFRLFDLLGVLLNEPFFSSVRWFGIILYPLVFIVTLVGGYMKLLFRPFVIRRAVHVNEPNTKDEKEVIIDLKKDEKTKSWGKIRKDFIQLMEDIVTSIRNAIGLNKKKRD